MAATAKEHIGVVKRLLQERNKENQYGWTAIMYAVKNGHSATLKMLLDYGADQNKKNTIKKMLLISLNSMSKRNA
ncbi:MAG: ankyrin repeat domain-containing protein [bacterium]